MCRWNSVVLTKRLNGLLLLRRLKCLCSIHLYQHLSWSLFCAWYRIWRKKVILVCCNFLVIVLRNHFNFLAIIWSWQHMRAHTSLCVGMIISWLTLDSMCFITVAFSVKHTCIKEISTVLESIRRSLRTIDRARSKRTIISLYAFGKQESKECAFAVFVRRCLTFNMIESLSWLQLNYEPILAFL